MLYWLMEFPKLLILGWFGKEQEEADTDKRDTLGMEANLDMALLFVSLFEKFNLYFLVAATPGFADQEQFTGGYGYEVDNLFYFLFCDWKTGWTLLYKPIEENERKKIDEIVNVRKYLKRTKFKLFSEV